MEELSSKLVEWLREQVKKAGLQGVINGLSGGVDSSVVSVLCHKAFPKSSLVLILPCHSQPLDIEHALLVVEKFGLRARKVVLDSVFDQLLESIGEVKGSTETEYLAKANLKPRLRMATLYYFANKLNYLVVGTGNRSELTVGYFTKYGDGAVDVLPLGNLVKTQVRELARYLGIPQVIINKPPSAGLWAGQTDEAEIGVTYSQLDQYILTGQAPGSVKKRIEALKEASEHKRAPIAIPPF
jgi:NAD+ synthase